MSVQTAPTMSMHDAMRAIHDARRDDDVVVTSMASAREWMLHGTHERDLVLVPSSMGQATSFALGIALAQPSRRVIACTGDGSLLMNLGTLVSITAAGAPNLVVVLVDNGVYEVTGSQPTAGAAAGRADATPVDFVAMARACGFRAVFRYGDAAEWTRDASRVLDTAGPVFVALDVASAPGTPGPRSPGPARARAGALMQALRT